MPWSSLLVLYGAGVLAAAQLGKLSALMPPIQRDLALDLTTAALLVSLLEAGGASLGLVTGRLMRGLGAKPALLAGAALLTLGGLAAGLAPGGAALFLARVVESLGYLAVVVAAPTLMAALAPPARRHAALALWTTFFPVGFAAGTMASGLLADLWSWRAALLVNAGLVALICAAALRLPGRSATPAAGPSGGGLPASVWQLSIGFGCYTIFAVGELALLPAYLVQAKGLPAGTAGLIAGLASIATVAGSFAAASLGPARAGPPLLMAAALLLPAGLLFLAFAPAADWRTVAAVAVALNAISGIVPALIFARMPELLGARGSMAMANGALAQFGAAGSLIGPPLYAACAGQWGWPGAAVAGAAASLLCLVLVAAAERPYGRAVSCS